MSKTLVKVPAVALPHPSQFFSQSVALSSACDYWETPPELFARLDAEHKFTLDPCSDGKNNLLPTHFTRRSNGLARSWRGHRAFMNPPYGRVIPAWVEKARRECRDSGVLVVALIPARTDTNWWHDHVLDACADVEYVRGRISFYLHGVKGGKAPFASAIVTYRPGQVR
jgi:phage N-6-adenine-methyltransferase